MANRATGKGYENETFYTNIKFQFWGIDNIHVMRASLQKLVEGSSLMRCVSGLSWLVCKADVRHVTKLSNFATLLCCATKLPVWLRKLPNFWRVAQLICRIETISILRQLLALSLSCDWSIVYLHVNCWLCCKLLTYYLLYIVLNISYFVSKLIYR